MALGYTKPLYLLAFDHRGSFERDLIAGTIGRSEAVDQIAAHYLKTVTAFVS
jgi:hypothetical protein